MTGSAPAALPVTVRRLAAGDVAAALHFYRSAGFVETGRIPAGFLQDGRAVDEVLMMCRLDPQPHCANVGATRRDDRGERP